MPVYGRHQNFPRPKTTPSKQPKGIIQSIERIGGKRKLTKSGRWGSNETPLYEVERCCWQIRKRAAEIIENGSTPVIVDWGCGEGRAIESIAEEYPAAKCYGYSREFMKIGKKARE